MGVVVQAWVLGAVWATVLAAVWGVVLGHSALAQAALETPWRSAGELTWRAPRDCADAGTAIRSRANELVPEGRRRGAARVEVQRAGEAWEAQVSTAAGERRLVGESCAAVLDAAAVVLALAAEPFAPPPPEPQQPPPPRKSAPGVPVDQRQKPALPTLVVTAGAFVELGALPGPSIGPRVLLTLNGYVWSIDAGLAALLPRRAELDASPAIYGDIYWWAGQLSACRRLNDPLAFCLGVESGSLVGTGYGVDEAVTARGTWLAGVLQLAWRGDLGPHVPLSWRADGGLALPALRPPFGFDELGVLHRASSVSARVFFGVGWP